MDKKIDFGVYIGRFQPMHVGHRGTIERALRECKHVIVCIGSTNSPRTSDDPWTFEERANLIRREFPHNTNLHIQPLDDTIYRNAAWIAQVESKVRAIVLDYYPSTWGKEIVRLYGHEKDETSFYIKSFPQWDPIDTGKYDDEILSATTVRDLYFADNPSKFYNGALPISVADFLKEFKKTTEFERLQEEFDMINTYNYPNLNAVTVDAVIIQSGHILLIKRRDAPGKDLWALPGGFVEKNETIREAFVRELGEETNLRVSTKVLLGSIVKEQYFDDPKRSQRCRIITHVFHVKLDDSKELPRVAGSSDAKEAKWFSLGEFDNMCNQMFDDHWHIVNAML